MTSERAKTPGERLHEWLQGRFTVRSFATRCGVSPSYISELRTQNRLPSAELRAAIERETDGLVKASEWLERPKESCKPLTSECRSNTAMSPDERLEAAIQEARDELNTVETDGARASLRATVIRAERDLAVLRSKVDIESHPQYQALCKRFIDAVVAVYGIDKLVALRDELEARGGASSERRAA